MINRTKVLEHAKAYWWRPCKDGMVYLSSAFLNVKELAAQKKQEKKATEDYVGVFLWYPLPEGLVEMLALVPQSKAKEIEKAKDEDRTWAKYSSVAVALASWKDDPKDDDLSVFLPDKPPYWGLNDCTHFSSECLVEGGFKIPPMHEATRGAGGLAAYLFNSPETKNLCWMVSQADAKAVVDAGVVQKGDIFTYHSGIDKYAHHSAVAVSSSEIAYHTDHAFGRDWSFGPSERYSIFHFADDNRKTGDAMKWWGWWKVEAFDGPAPKGPKVDPKFEYYHFDESGTLTVTSTEPKPGKPKPDGRCHLWFAREAGKSKTVVVVRRNGVYDHATSVEVFTDPGPKPGDPAAGERKNPPKGSPKRLQATKLF